MSDLVKRLRKANGWDFLSIVQEGADRIEHLERVLMQAREAMHSCIPADYSKGHIIHASYDEDAIDSAIAAIDEALNTPISGGTSAA